MIDGLTLAGLGWAPDASLVVYGADQALGAALAITAARAGLAVARVDWAATGLGPSTTLGALPHLVVVPPSPDGASDPVTVGMAHTATLIQVTEAWLDTAGEAAESAVFVTTEPTGAPVSAPAALGYARHLAHRLGGRTRFNTVAVPDTDHADKDIARSALFLLSPAASYVTGTSLVTAPAGPA